MQPIPKSLLQSISKDIDEPSQLHSTCDYAHICTLSPAHVFAHKDTHEHLVFPLLEECFVKPFKKKRKKASLLRPLSISPLKNFPWCNTHYPCPLIHYNFLLSSFFYFLFSISPNFKTMVKKCRFVEFLPSLCPFHSLSSLYVNSALQRQPTADEKYFKTPESSRKKNLNLLYGANYLYSIFII